MVVIPKKRMLLTGEEADLMFGRTCRIDGDASLAALLRAVVLKYGDRAARYRDDNVRIGFKTVFSDCEEAKRSFDFGGAALTIVTCGERLFNENVDGGDEWRGEFFVGRKLFPVNQYLSQVRPTKIYISERQKRIVAFVRTKVTHVWIQALESVLCRLMPWYYPTDLPEEDCVFYRSIAVDNKDVAPEEKVEIFVRYVNEIANKTNFRDLVLRKALDGVAEMQREREIASLSISVSDTMKQIDALTAQLAVQYGKLSTQRLMLDALTKAAPQSDDAMVTFFSTHKQVHLTEVSDEYLGFCVVDTLEFYDEDRFMTACSGDWLFAGERDKRVSDGVKAIFHDRRGVLRVGAQFKLWAYKLVEAIIGEMPHEGGEEYMPNPHIGFYGCSGDNDQYYAQFAKNGEWDLAIEQAISATKNLNWADTTVCRRMMEWLTDHDDVPCIYVDKQLRPIEKVTEDMERVSFREFVGRIANQGGADNGETNICHG